MKRILAITLLLCSTAHAQQVFKAAPQQSSPIATADAVSDGLQPLAQIPWVSDEDMKRSAFGVSAGRDGVAPEGAHPTVRNRIVQNYWGAGIVAKAGESRITDCISRHNYIGVRLDTSDNTISGCYLYNNRDVCLWIARSTRSSGGPGYCDYYDTIAKEKRILRNEYMVLPAVP